MIWTQRQRAALACILAVVFALLAVRYAMGPVHVGDPQPAEGALARQLADRVDPNTAEETILGALPALGPKLAARVVAGREALARENPRRPPFTRPSDLMRVKGIGQATTRAVAPYLVFPSTQEAAR